MTYITAKPYKFYGKALLSQPTAPKFVKELCAEVGINREGISALHWDKNSGKYVKAQLRFNCTGFQGQKIKAQILAKWLKNHDSHNQSFKIMRNN